MHRNAITFILTGLAAAIGSSALGDCAPVKPPKPKAGKLVGTITYDGGPPTVGTPATFVRKDKFCTAHAAKIKDQSLLVSPKGGIANVVVYLAKRPKGYKPTPPPKKPVIFEARFCTFQPHILIVRAGQHCEFHNRDATHHNMHRYPAVNHEYGRVLATKQPERFVYEKPEPIPVKVGCDVHPWMSAYHVVLDHPFVAITDRNGKFSIEGLPVGTHSFRIWHEKSGWLAKARTVTIRPSQATRLDLDVEPKTFTQNRRPRSRTVVLETKP